MALLVGAAYPVQAGNGNEAQKVELRRQLDALTERLARLEVKREAAPKARRIAPAAAVESGSRPRSWKLPGTNTSMQIGGFAQLDLIYDINASSGDGLSSNGASNGSFPSTGTAAANRQGNFRLHAKRSRIVVRTWTPTDWGSFETKIEADFQGAGGNQLISNSNAFRLRKAYGRLGPILAGQDSSTFRFGAFEPRTFEDRGPASKGGPRQGLIRYTRGLGGGTQLEASIENPETGRAATSTGYALPIIVSGGGLNDPVPDFVLALNHKWSNGIVRFGALFGSRGAEDGAGAQARDFMWGIQGAILVRFNQKRTTIALLGHYGYGTGRYFRGQPAEVIVTGTTSANMNVSTTRTFGGYAWLRHQWTDTIQTNLVFGRIDGDVESKLAKALIPARTLDLQWTIEANIVYEPVKNVAFALEYLMAKTQYHNARESTVQRIQVSAVYKF